MAAVNHVKKSAKISVKDIVFAELTKDDSTGVTYATDVHHVPGVNEITMTVNKSESNLTADDNPAYDSYSAIDTIDVNLTMANWPVEVKSFLLGSQIDKYGVLVTSANDVAPYVAMGFKTKLSDNSWDYEWYYKGKFKLSDMRRKSREKGNVDYQTEALSAEFVQRDNDGKMMVAVNENDTKFTTAIKDAFFDAPYVPDFTTGP